MQIESEKSEQTGIWVKILFFLKKIRPTRHNFGWWLLVILISIIFGGIVRTWFVPDSHYLDPIVRGIEFILPALDWVLGLFGKTRTRITNVKLEEIIHRLGNGVPVTISITVISVILGFLLGSILAIILVNKKPLFGLKFIAQVYVDFFRCTPLLVQILIVFFGTSFLVPLIRNLNIESLSYPIFAGTIALSLNTAAYQAEIVRGGILAIPVGQTEAARALGLSTGKAMQYVILPQAVRIIIPPLTNELINVLLNSSLVSNIGVVEITKQAVTSQSYYALWEAFIFAAVFYFIIAFSLSKITKKVEVKLRIPGLGVCYD